MGEPQLVALPVERRVAIGQGGAPSGAGPALGEIESVLQVERGVHQAAGDRVTVAPREALAFG
mgnify:CR=1 FL=1